VYVQGLSWEKERGWGDFGSLEKKEKEPTPGGGKGKVVLKGPEKKNKRALSILCFISLPPEKGKKRESEW